MKRTAITLTVIMSLALVTPLFGCQQAKPAESTTPSPPPTPSVTLPSPSPTLSLAPTPTPSPTPTETPATAPTPSPTPTETPTPTPPLITMTLHKSTRYPYTVQLPANDKWTVNKAGTAFYFTGTNGRTIFLDEFDLKATMGETSTELFAASYITYLRDTRPVFRLVLHEKLSTAQGLPAEVIVFNTTHEDDIFAKSRQFMYVHDIWRAATFLFICVHENRTAVILEYFVPYAFYDEMKPLIKFSFDSFVMTEAPWIPGTTQTDLQLQNDVLKKLMLAEPEYKSVMNTEVTEWTNAQGKWVERWTLDRSGVAVVYEIRFELDPKGGTFFTVTGPLSPP